MLAIGRGRRNLSIVFIYVSCEKNNIYRVVSLGQSSFDCRLYCERRRRIQGGTCLKSS